MHVPRTGFGDQTIRILCACWTDWKLLLSARGNDKINELLA